MSSQRRSVRASVDFFADLDRHLGDERGPRGEPSRYDFQAGDLLEIVERFATGWDELPQLIPGRPEYRVLISTGRAVRAYSVEGQLAADGAVNDSYGDAVAIGRDLPGTIGPGPLFGATFEILKGPFLQIRGMIRMCARGELNHPATPC